MAEVQKHYESRFKIAETEVKRIKKQINLLVLARVFSFLTGVFMVVFFWSQPLISVISGVGFTVMFGIFIKYHLRKKEEKGYWSAIATFYKEELKGLTGDWSFANGGEAYNVPNHDFAHDIDLFGEKSFFQRINKTSLKGGEEHLAKMLLSNSCDEVEELQIANKELREKREFIEGFIGYARIHETEVASDVVKNWLGNYQAFLPKWVRYLGWTFSVASIGVIFFFGLNLISGFLLSGWLVLGLMTVGVWLKPITKFNYEINKIVRSIKSYGKLMTLLEKENFESDILSKLQSSIQHKDVKASAVIDDLSRRIDLFNNRNNLLVILLGNGFFLWDLQTTFRLQRWFQNHKEDVVVWLDVLYEFDALLSLANYSNVHPEYVYPELSPSKNIHGVHLGHPLIDVSQCITNDVNIEPQSFLIITGANMAGKSTFLRTISLSILMTNLGLPVFAKEFSIKPQKLITSMRSSDSLLEDESYFFAELKRLKFIVDKIEKENYFIVLDEILKGTNSKDKEEGSKKFVKRLVEMGATGIIATHDLGLCEIEKELPPVSNYYFDAEIINDELHFDYGMKEGICKNMNASFLLKKMEIVKD